MYPMNIINKVWSDGKRKSRGRQGFKALLKFKTCTLNHFTTIFYCSFFFFFQAWEIYKGPVFISDNKQLGPGPSWGEGDTCVTCPEHNENHPWKCLKMGNRPQGRPQLSSTSWTLKISLCSKLCILKRKRRPQIKFKPRTKMAQRMSNGMRLIYTHELDQSSMLQGLVICKCKPTARLFPSVTA